MTPEELQNRISQSKGIVLYFKNEHCGPCQVLRPKVAELIHSQFNKMEFLILDTETQPLLSSAFNVFSNPTILVFFEGKEYLRKSKYIGVYELGIGIERLYKMVY